WASDGGGKHPRQRCTQYSAVTWVIRPGARAINERTLGARPANAAAQPNTASPVEEATGKARPCPAGADKPGHNAFNWACNRSWATLRSLTRARRWRTE